MGTQKGEDRNRRHTSKVCPLGGNTYTHAVYRKKNYHPRKGSRTRYRQTGFSFSFPPQKLPFVSAIKTMEHVSSSANISASTVGLAQLSLTSRPQLRPGW